MELTQEIVTNDMHKIKRILAESFGFDDVFVEYPGFLVIEHGERVYHAGYVFNYDESLDGDFFNVYDFTDGYQHPFNETFATYDDLRFVSRKLRDLITKNPKESN